MADEVVQDSGDDLSKAEAILGDDSSDESSSDETVDDSDKFASDESTEDDTQTDDESTEETSDTESDTTDEESGSDEDSETEDTPEDEKKEDVVEDKITRPSFKALQKAYPDIFKKFPELRQVYFRDAQFGAMFTSPEEARITVETAENFDFIQGQLASGNIDAIVQNLQPATQEVMADKILSSLYEVNPKLYFRSIAPAFSEMLNNAFKKGQSENNENLQRSVLNLCGFLYGKRELPKLPTDVKADPRVQQELETLRAERVRDFNQKASGFERSVEGDIETRLKKSIINGLDPNNELSDFTKNAVVEDVITKIGNVVKKDAKFLSTLRLAYRKAAKVGFTDNMKSQIISAYMGRVNSLVPKLRSQARSEALGKKKNPNAPQGNKTIKKESMNSPMRSSSGGKVNIGNNVPTSKIDYRRTTFDDIYNGKATLKSGR